MGSRWKEWFHQADTLKGLHCVISHQGIIKFLEDHGLGLPYFVIHRSYSNCGLGL